MRHAHCFDCGSTVEVEGERCAYCGGRCLGRAAFRLSSIRGDHFRCRECGAGLSADAVANPLQRGDISCHCGSHDLKKLSVK